MKIYKPPGYIEYQEFFDHILDVLLPDSPEKEKIKQGTLCGGFFSEHSYYRFAFYDLDDQSQGNLQALLMNDFEINPNKVILFDYVQVQFQHMRKSTEFDYYSLYKASESKMWFQGYDADQGVYSVEEEIYKHRYIGCDDYKQDSCYQEKEGEEVTHHKIVNLPCHCQKDLKTRFYSRHDLLCILYTNQVWKRMRDALVDSSVRSILSGNANPPIESEKWLNTNWWYSIVINRRLHAREISYLFNEDDVLKYCSETLPSRLNGKHKTALPASIDHYPIALQLAIEAVNVLGEAINKIPKEVLESEIKKISNQKYPSQDSFFSGTKIKQIATLIRSEERAKGGIFKTE